MPHIDDPEGLVKEAYASGKFQNEPEHRDRAPPAGCESPRPDDSGEVAEAASGALDAPQTPSHLIRMTHPDGGDADGYEHDASGAILAPVSAVEGLKSHGFRVDHLRV
jgi:hypothetical protein